MVPRLVEPEEIPAAMALQSLGMQIAQLGGPALAGLLIAAVDLSLGVRVRPGHLRGLADLPHAGPRRAAAAGRRPPVAARGGHRPALRHVSRPELLGTYLVDINAMFFGMPQALYPFLATQLGGPRSSACSTPRPRSAR